MTKLPLTVKASSAVGSPTAPGCNGVYQASIVSTADPLQQGRVTLKIPQVLGTATSNWALPVGSATLLGTVAVGQMVHAWFLGGNRNLPVYAPLSWSQSANLTITGNLTVGGTSALHATTVTTLGATGAATLSGGETVTGGSTIDILNGTLKVFKINSTSRSFNTTTPANDPDLQNIPYVANGIYEVELCAFTTDSGNLEYTFSFTSSPPNAGRYQAIQNNLSSQFQGIQSGWTANNTANTTEPILIKGLFNNTGGAAGTFSFQWCNNTSNTQATVQSASYMKLERFA